MTRLVALAEEWIAPFRDAHHLRRTRDWLLEIEPEAGEALVLAALTHDMERHFPGGPVVDPGRCAPDDAGYNRAHQERSARIVGEWLREQEASAELAAQVSHLIERHELGGDDGQDLLQAADSLSFLETKTELMIRWLREGKCGPERALAQPRWMLERIRLERARPLARPLCERAVAEVEAEIARLSEAGR